MSAPQGVTREQSHIHWFVAEQVALPTMQTDMPHCALQSLKSVRESH